MINIKRPYNKNANVKNISEREQKQKLHSRHCAMCMVQIHYIYTSTYMLSYATTNSLQHSFGTSLRICIKNAKRMKATWVGLSLV